MRSKLFFFRISFLLIFALLFAGACGYVTTATDDDSEKNDPSSDKEDNTDPDIIPGIIPEPGLGETNFISADAELETNSRDDDKVEGGDEDVPTVDEGGEGTERTVEQGDIYRVGVGGQIIFNLNSFRGLQVIDISDLDNPTIIGRLPIYGYPVEMYVTSDKAYMLLNNWQSYWGNREDLSLTAYSGGLLVSVDISDLENPVEIDRAIVPGYISTSRLIGNNTDRAIYIAANNWNQESETVIKSFYLNNDGTLEDKTLLSLGGYVTDIQSGPDTMTVARFEWTRVETDDTDSSQDNEGYVSTVTVIDVSDPHGSMTQGAEIKIEGMVQNKTNMDVYGNILRVASGSNWSGTNINHLQTFDISDISNPIAIDHDTFGENEQLYATLFLGNKAFFVTYFRTDPFHAFEIDDEGNAEEKAEYIVSGWNNFFRPVFADTRIIGIGTNDEEGNKMAVSLYDISDLSNPNPFIARQEVTASDYSWSEASFDDRAFSIIENSISVQAPDSEINETGLILLPFSGYDSDNYKYVNAVQMFSFSENTLTQRGILSHGSPVRRSFNPQDNTTANISEKELSLFNTRNPDSPVEMGKVELAPNYADLMVFGNLGVRVKTDEDYYYYYYEKDDSQSASGKHLETVSLSDPETTEPLASIEIGIRDEVFKAGNLLISVSRYQENNDELPTTSIKVFDYSNPLSPSLTSTITTQSLNYTDYYYVDCDMGMRSYYSAISALAMDKALVFPEHQWHQEVIGTATDCSAYRYIDDKESCEMDGWGCSWIDAYKHCTKNLNGIENCNESITQCSINEEGVYNCIPLEEIPSDMSWSCYTYDNFRYWNTTELTVLDLSDPANPSLSDKIQMPENEEAAGILVRGKSLYVNYKIPVITPDDSREYARYFFKEVDLTIPSSPKISKGVNIPGILKDVVGNTLYTEEAAYRDDNFETAINKLERVGDLAELKARKRFSDRYVTAFVTDKSGNALVLHAPNSYYRGDDIAVDSVSDTPAENISNSSILTILDMNDDMTVLSETPIDVYADLKTVKNNKALFSISGGILVINLDDLTKPVAQAYFPMIGWPYNTFVYQNTVYMPSGQYGIQTFDIDSYNLMK